MELKITKKTPGLLCFWKRTGTPRPPRVREQIMPSGKSKSESNLKTGVPADKATLMIHLEQSNGREMRAQNKSLQQGRIPFKNDEC